MSKVLSYVTLVLTFTDVFCFLPIYPYRRLYPQSYGPLFNNFEQIESPRIPVPDNGPELLKKFTDLNCVMENFGGECMTKDSISVYRNTEECEFYLYGGCLNNQARFYTAEMCNGECRLPSNVKIAPATNYLTPSSTNEANESEINRAAMNSQSDTNAASTNEANESEINRAAMNSQSDTNAASTNEANESEINRAAMNSQPDRNAASANEANE